MIRKSNARAGVMEFTSFTKKAGVSDDELIQAVMKFESSFLASQQGVLFHCLVRNLKNEYANVLFATDMTALKELEEAVHANEDALYFFSLIEEGSVQMNFQTIEKEKFTVPAHFSCVEYGTFALKNESDFQELLRISDTIEKEYLSKTDNTQAHFIGRISDNLFSEVTFGSTLEKTREVCLGYLENEYCKPMLEMADAASMKLDFWYVINETEKPDFIAATAAIGTGEIN